MCTRLQVKLRAALVPMVLCLGADAVRAADPAVPAAPSGDRFGRVYPARIYNAIRLMGPSPSIDGRLDDPAWQEGEWSGGYTQQKPTEGAPPSQPTELKILYDERNVYVGIRAYDEMGKIHRYSGRRDEFTGDSVGVCFDSYFDKQTGFEFGITAAGNKLDEIVGNETWDNSWNAVWDGKVAHEKDRWTAEFRIPLSQLRYGPQDEQVWGLHAFRLIDRNMEEDQWQLIPRSSAANKMYNFGELRGIRGLKRHRRIELLPYSLGQMTSAPRENGNPYRTGPSWWGSGGLDAKVGLTSDFTLDAAINPDFGQVEADPSVVNLSAYETFYDEKRPFFLEGRNIMTVNSFDLGAWGDQLFYSRRIGRVPSRTPELREGESLDAPNSTTILSALKVTGKTAGGLSVGILQSLTASEEARLTFKGVERREPVEPFASYTALRTHKDWDKGNTSVGGMLTSVRRSIKSDYLTWLPTSAVTGGLEFTRYFANRTYSLDASGVFSRVSGSTTAISELQRNAVHYFQRVDAEHLELDQTATVLAGHGGLVRVRRKGSSRLRLENTFRWRSPGLDLNDIGYQRQGDVLANDFEVVFEEPSPKGIFRDFGVFLGRWDSWDFGGLHTDGATTVRAWGRFSNKWYASAEMRRSETAANTRLLRGGPAIRVLPYWNPSVNVHTDESRRTSYWASGYLQASGHDDLYRYGLSPRMELRLSPRFSVSAQVDYHRQHNGLEYVATPEIDGPTRYVLGAIDQKTIGATVRLNLHLTPNLSFQFYGSPFISTGRYTQLKRATQTRAARYEERFELFSPAETRFDSEANVYHVTETGGLTYSFNNPDFSFREFRSNLVARWEYRPGSALYVVWSQGRTSSVSEWERSAGRNFDALWSTPSTNIFLVKLSHWFGL